MLFNAVASLQITPSVLAEISTRVWLTKLRDELDGQTLHFMLWDGKALAASVKVQSTRVDGPHDPQLDDFFSKYGFELILSMSEDVNVEDLTTMKFQAKGSETWETFTLTLEEAERGQRDRIASDLTRIASDIILAAYLSAPGSFNVREFTVSINGERHKSPSNDVLDLWSAPPVDQGRQFGGWPPIASIPFRDVLDWLLAIDGFAKGLPKGPSGRAVSALTHALSEHGLQVVWAVLGLEALYCVDNKDLANQLRQKSTALLGEPREYKKRVQELYDHRSKLVHGGLDIPLAYEWVEVLDEFEHYLERQMHTSDFAITLLVSTIQQLIQNRGYRLESDFKVRVV